MEEVRASSLDQLTQHVGEYSPGLKPPWEKLLAEMSAVPLPESVVAILAEIAQNELSLQRLLRLYRTTFSQDAGDVDSPSELSLRAATAEFELYCLRSERSQD